MATSASGLTLTELQDGWQDPGRFVLGHPFNPPHLIPLVEVMGNDRTEPGVVDLARGFYESIGKVTIEVRREVPGHVANRLQAALWREAIHLVNEGVASVVDVDKAVSAGPGCVGRPWDRPTLFHLGADEGSGAVLRALRRQLQPLVGRPRRAAPRRRHSRRVSSRGWPSTAATTRTPIWPPAATPSSPPSSPPPTHEQNRGERAPDLDHTSFAVHDALAWARRLRRELGATPIAGETLTEFRYVLLHVGHR